MQHLPVRALRGGPQHGACCALVLPQDGIGGDAGGGDDLVGEEPQRRPARAMMPATAAARCSLEWWARAALMRWRHAALRAARRAAGA